MKAIYKISSESAAELRERIRTTKNAVACRRMEAVALLGEGKTPEEVAEIKKYHAVYVRHLAVLYHKEGIDALGSDGRRGGNNRMMSKDEATEFLEQFKEQARAGEMITVGVIAQALNAKTGRERKSLSTVYSLLHQHGWRKVMPRSKHPNKASDEEIESSKKLTYESKN